MPNEVSHAPKEYYAVVTINTPRGEFDHDYQMGSLDAIASDVLEHYPDCTSMVMAIVIRRDSGIHPTTGDTNAKA